MTGANWFEANLTVDHGKAIRARLSFRSEADGTFRMAEQLTALADITTAEVATGLLGVLNNPHWIYESARRRVTDQLILNHLPGDRAWTKGQILSDYRVTIRCARGRP